MQFQRRIQVNSRGGTEGFSAVSTNAINSRCSPEFFLARTPLYDYKNDHSGNARRQDRLTAR